MKDSEFKRIIVFITNEAITPKKCNINSVCLSKKSGTCHYFIGVHHGKYHKELDGQDYALCRRINSIDFILSISRMEK